MSSHLAPNLVLDGYRLVRFLGRGGFGEVWLCQSESMGDYRALKFIPAGDSDRLEKEYEALLHYRKAAARLRSPHLLPIEHVNRNDVGLWPRTAVPRAETQQTQASALALAKLSVAWVVGVWVVARPPGTGMVRSGLAAG